MQLTDDKNYMTLRLMFKNVKVWMLSSDFGSKTWLGISYDYRDPKTETHETLMYYDIIWLFSCDNGVTNRAWNI